MARPDAWSSHRRPAAALPNPRARTSASGLCRSAFSPAGRPSLPAAPAASASVSPRCWRAGRGTRVVLADLRADHLDAALARFAAAPKPPPNWSASSGASTSWPTMPAARLKAPSWRPHTPITTSAWGEPGRRHQRPRRLLAADDRAWARRPRGLHCQPRRLGGDARAPGDLRREQGRRVPLLRSHRPQAARTRHRHLHPAAGPGRQQHPRGRCHRPAHPRAVRGDAASEERLARRIVGDDWMQPAQVGELLAEGILANRLYLVTHGVYRPSDDRALRSPARCRPRLHRAAARFHPLARLGPPPPAHHHRPTTTGEDAWNSSTARSPSSPAGPAPFWPRA